jgi:Fe-S cluster assembly iron-binding protein IscA
MDFAPGAAETPRAAGATRRAFLRLWYSAVAAARYQYGLAFDSSTEGDDQIVETAGIPIAIDAQSQPFCDSATIEYIDETEYPAAASASEREARDRQGCGAPAAAVTGPPFA